MGRRDLSNLLWLLQQRTDRGAGIRRLGVSVSIYLKSIVTFCAFCTIFCCSCENPAEDAVSEGLGKEVETSIEMPDGVGLGPQGVWAYKTVKYNDTMTENFIPCQNLSSEEQNFDIVFDYRFDNGFFSDHPDRQKALETAAAVWERIIAEDLPDVPAGEVVTISNPETGGEETIILENGVDDLLLFVFAYDKDSAGNKATGGFSYRRSRGENTDEVNGPDVEPYVGFLAFNTQTSREWFADTSIETSGDIPSQTHYDLISTASHEIGHALGFLVSSYKSAGVKAGDTFTGENAVVWNRYLAIPLEKDSSHIAWSFRYGIARPDIESHVMHGTVVMGGLRFLPTLADALMLKDIGYDIRPDCVPHPPDTIADPDPRAASYRKIHPDYATNTALPVGLWAFDEPSYIFSSIVGHPVKYIGTPDHPMLKASEGGVEVAKGTFLLVSHGIAPQGDSNFVSHYTIVQDIRLPSLGVDYPLFNTNITNSNGAEVWVNKDGAVGAGDYSEKKLEPNKWARVVVSFDKQGGERRYYVNGELWLTQSGGLGTVYELDTQESSGGLLVFFGDGNGDDASILVRRLGLYDEVLSQDKVADLGGPDNPID